MTDILEAHLLRLGRAYGHLETLADHMDEFVEEHRDLLADEFHLEDGAWWYIVHTVEWPDPSPEWGLLIGEAMHQFRATLDNLVWSLVEANDSKPSDTCAFPICSTQIDWTRRVLHTRRTRDPNSPLVGVSEEAFAAIDDRQPYKRGNDAKRHPLAKLNRLNNVDKHQVAHTLTLTSPEKSPIVYFRSDGGELLLRDFRLSSGKRLHGETKIEMFRVRLPRTFVRARDAEKVHVEDIGIEVAISPRRYVLRDLQEIAREVTVILNDFAARFFPSSQVIPYLNEMMATQDELGS